MAVGAVGTEGGGAAVCKLGVAASSWAEVGQLASGAMGIAGGGAAVCKLVTGSRSWAVDGQLASDTAGAAGPCTAPWLLCFHGEFVGDSVAVIVTFLSSDVPVLVPRWCISCFRLVGRSFKNIAKHTKHCKAQQNIQKL